MKIQLLILLVTFSVTLYAQNISDKEQIKSTVQTYFDGWATGDTAKLTQAMHPTCQLKTYRDGRFNLTDRAKYLSFFKPQQPEENLKTRIVKLDFTANIASVKTEISTDKYLFTDYLHLIKTNEGWVIVDKIAYRFDK